MSDELVNPQVACLDCATAALQLHHGFRNGCHQCRARAFSRSPTYAAREKTVQGTEHYRQMLWAGGVTDDDVQGAAEADWMQSNPVTAEVER